MTLTYSLLCLLCVLVGWFGHTAWTQLRRRYAKPRPIDYGRLPTKVSEADIERIKNSFSGQPFVTVKWPDTVDGRPHRG